MKNNTTNNEKTIKFSTKQITISVCNSPIKVFLQDGFYQHKVEMNLVSPNYYGTPHYHNYPEIHCFIGGQSSFLVDDKMIELNDSTALIVPKNVYHFAYPREASHFAFQIDMPASKFSTVYIPSELLQEVFDEIAERGPEGNHSRIADYLSFISSYFSKRHNIPASSTTDHSFIIQSFLSIHYNKNIHLQDVANELHVSIKHAERLVLLYTGNTFNNELTKYRITAAEHLMKINPQLSIGEIANLVGYESHSGFWKAYKRYREGKCEPKK